jgi:hypothetical protein
MNEGLNHKMVLETTHSSGAEEWSCPTCGRRMTITWQPWKKIILEPGDIQAAHSGSKGGLQLGPLQINLDNMDTPPSATEPPVDDPYLDPWLRWLDKIDPDDFWNDEV